ncbi:unnamed protein product [Prorocentrum cordatum]|uniref:Uncharacterized protein n=1 Tax=Prorocentrum cordatum TaxID=2364126 RepID=A0ABN9RP52_9DINO|nr:unnamed protein product [Polarella glacialis]
MPQRPAAVLCAALAGAAALGEARRVVAGAEAYAAAEEARPLANSTPEALPRAGSLLQGAALPLGPQGWPALEGEAEWVLNGALKALGVRGSEVTGRLPELVAKLEAAHAHMEEELVAMNARLGKMPMSESPSTELLALMNTYKVLFDEQWIGERSPPAAGLTNAEIRAIQESEFHMTAPKMASELLKAWREHGPAEYRDEKFDKRLEEVADMLHYPQAKQSLSISGHIWQHLTNVFMLMARSLRDLIQRRPLTWNLGAVGIVGSNLCNAAAREAREDFLAGATKGLHLMEFAIRWVLEKHMRVVRKLFMAMPRHKAYSEDAAFMAELAVAEKSLVHDWTKEFKIDYEAQLDKATLNIQQFKIQRKLHVMARGPENTQVNKDYQIQVCTDVPGAEGRDSTEFPSCKCGKDEEKVYCGIEKVAERKFDAAQVRSHVACTYSQPYCASQPMKHELRDLAVLLDPVPTSDCSKLYDELADSSVDQLVMFLGTQMYYMLYGTEEPIRKNPDFASTMYARLKGTKTENFIGKAFPSIGQRQRLLDEMEKKSASIADIGQVQAYFQDAMVKGKTMIAP